MIRVHAPEGAAATERTGSCSAVVKLPAMRMASGDSVGDWFADRGACAALPPSTRRIDCSDLIPAGGCGFRLLNVVPSGMHTRGSVWMFPVLMKPARARSARSRSFAVRSDASDAVERTSSLKVRLASLESAISPSTTARPATSATVSSFSVKPRARADRGRRLMAARSP